MKAHTKIGIVLGGIVGVGSFIYTMIDTPSLSNALGGIVLSIFIWFGVFIVVYFVGEFLRKATGRG